MLKSEHGKTKWLFGEFKEIKFLHWCLKGSILSWSYYTLSIPHLRLSISSKNWYLPFVPGCLLNI